MWYELIPGYFTYLHPLFWFCIGFITGAAIYMVCFCILTGHYISKVKDKLLTEHKKYQMKQEIKRLKYLIEEVGEEPKDTQKAAIVTEVLTSR